MFIRLEENKTSLKVATDVIANEKKFIRYKSLLQILKTIHRHIFPHKKVQSTKV